MEDRFWPGCIDDTSSSRRTTQHLFRNNWSDCFKTFMASSCGLAIDSCPLWTVDAPHRMPICVHQYNYMQFASCTALGLAHLSWLLSICSTCFVCLVCVSMCVCRPTSKYKQFLDFGVIFQTNLTANIYLNIYNIICCITCRNALNYVWYLVRSEFCPEGGSTWTPQCLWFH